MNKKSCLLCRKNEPPVFKIRVWWGVDAYCHPQCNAKHEKRIIKLVGENNAREHDS